MTNLVRWPAYLWFASVLFCSASVLPAATGAEKKSDVVKPSPVVVKEKTIPAAAKEKPAPPSGETPVGEAQAQSPTAATGEQQPSEDELSIRGHWIVARMQKDGKEPTTLHGELQYFFTDKEVKVSSVDRGFVFQYTLAPPRTPKEPKQLNLRVPGYSPLVRGIYRFQGKKPGESLVLCIPSSSEQPRPKEFATHKGDGRQTCLLQRAKADGTQPAFLRPGFKPAEEKLAEALRARLRTANELLASKKYDKFLTESMVPEELKAAQSRDKTAAKSTAEHLAKTGPLLAAMLQAAEKKTPTVNEAGTEASFDLRDIHVNGAPPKPEFKLAKIGGTWYLRNK
ncbi:MAG: hypothetical protein ABSG68_09125 [Thermoguttaceae bacterium]